MSASSRPIGIFDSGIGGLTVMKRLVQLLPNERFVYFGDTARLPYGNKSRTTIIRYSIENTIGLLEREIKMLIVACNTASALALSKLQQLFRIPILGVIEPGAKAAIKSTRTHQVALLGTTSTIQSGAYQEAIKKLAPQTLILPLPCPLFVPLVEEQWLHHPASRLIVREYLRPLQGKQVDTLLLGCTHYPLMSALIQQEVGEEVALVDSASGCAEEATLLLSAHKLLSTTPTGPHHYYVSDDPEKFRLLARTLFDHPIDVVGPLSPSH